jgi:hypothetical protein
MKENKDNNIKPDAQSTSLLNGKLFKFKKNTSTVKRFGDENSGPFNSLINLEPEQVQNATE